MSSLEKAIRQHDIKLLEESLLVPGALKQRGSAGETALHMAAQLGYSDLLELLLRAGADISAEDCGSRTALHVAAAEGHLEVCTLLVSRNSSLVKRCTSSGNTPLHRAAAYGHTHVVNFLISANSPVNTLNGEGATPLCRATRWGHTGVVRALLRSGASPSIADSTSRTPADWASHKGFTWVLEYLKEAEDGAGKSSPPKSPLDANRSATPLPTLSTDIPQPGMVLTVEGWMAKEGHFFKNWKNRWFLLEGRRLLYFSKPTARKPQGIIQLSKGSDVFVEERYSRPFCFTILTQTKKFILQAANEEEMAEWIEVRFFYTGTQTPPEPSPGFV